MAGTSKPLFRHRGVSLLRAAAVTADDIPTQWPDLTDAESCRAWLQDVWTRFGLVEAIHLASSDLAARVEVICVDGCSVDRSVRRATMSTMRYLLRAIGRHTPFGLFAGATPVSIGSDVDVRWGDDHQPVLRVDTQWLLDVVEQLEACDSLLNRLDVVDSNLVVRRGDRLEVPQGPGKATIRQTKAVEIALDAAASPIRFETLAAKVTAHFPGADAARVRGMLVSLVQQGFLITSLRAPLTVTDPLAHVIARLHDVGAAAMPAAAERLRALTKIEREVSRHNDANSTSGERRGIRTTLTGQMRQVSGAGRV